MKSHPPTWAMRVEMRSSGGRSDARNPSTLRSIYGAFMRIPTTLPAVSFHGSTQSFPHLLSQRGMTVSRRIWSRSATSAALGVTSVILPL